MAGTIHIPWYSTGLRGDRLQKALLDVTATSVRYGATEWSLHRSHDDRHKFLQIVHFDDKLDFERWWLGNEMTEFRAMSSGWYQIPLLYTPHDTVGEGRVDAGSAGNGAAATAPQAAA